MYWHTSVSLKHRFCWLIDLPCRLILSANWCICSTWGHGVCSDHNWILFFKTERLWTVNVCVNAVSTLVIFYLWKLAWSTKSPYACNVERYLGWPNPFLWEIYLFACKVRATKQCYWISMRLFCSCSQNHFFYHLESWNCVHHYEEHFKWYFWYGKWSFVLLQGGWRPAGNLNVTHRCGL